MTDETREFCQASGPFKAVHRATSVSLAEWVVRDVVGYAVAECDEEDAARAIADALNAVAARADARPTGKS